jgi:hypothetical protein
MGRDKTDAVGRRALDPRDRDTIRRALRSAQPPRYSRSSRPSKLDPFRGEIAELLRAEPRIPSQRIRELIAELGFDGAKTIVDDYVREVRPRHLPLRTYQRTIYRPGELCQFDLWEPSRPIPVGHGQLRRGWVVTAELGYSRALAATLVFSTPTSSPPGASPTTSTTGPSSTPGPLAPTPAPTAPRARSRLSGCERSVGACGACPSRCPTLTAASSRRCPPQPYLRVDRNYYSLDPRFAGRRVEIRASQSEIGAVVLDTGELAARHRRSFAGGLTFTDPAHQAALDALRGERRRGRDIKVERRPLERYDALIPRAAGDPIVAGTAPGCPQGGSAGARVQRAPRCGWCVRYWGSRAAGGRS